MENFEEFKLEQFRFSRDEIDRLLVWGFERGASAFQFLPNKVRS